VIGTMKKLKRCRECGSYTLADICVACDVKAGSPHPPRFSPQDKFGKYRRMLKRASRDDH
jgi:H/ACA ribonucleoprotein complex subunit 3